MSPRAGDRDRPGDAPAGPGPEAVPVPDALRRGAATTPDGAAWLTRLPALVDRARTRWGLRLERPFEPGTTAWTAPARTRDGADAVVKIVLPHAEAAGEAAALRAWAGQGAVELLDHDTEDWTLLLRRARPGHGLEEDRLLAERPAPARLDIAGELLARLHDAPHPADGVAALASLVAPWAELLRDRAARLAGPLELDTGLVAEAAGLLEELPGSAARTVLVHGDLNPGNILAADDGTGRTWLAIDPKPALGDPACDPWPLLTQVGAPFTDDNPPATLRTHTRVLCAAAGLEADRVAAWALARSCESALWRAAVQGDRDGALAELAQARTWARML
ncbi:aminoglycoside phosphotransferase family protein [Georgenia yuyongxinii]|uniref:Phosphotransferase n=1 Tax=Georgenia yuyongxinii TaxID=2589797 RepID=A0A552WTZ6_9MICO|nr:aminoglycoside phosphotransferase family protein [Georgenia yuyongxinii]TRW46227.1 phosphotransferase [Georgenia yuyongxinii]